MNRGGIIKFVQSEDPFARIPNETARDSSLSPESLGVLVFLASFPETWNARDFHIQAHFNFGKDRMRAIWKKLVIAGYAKRDHRQNLGGGRIGTITTVSIYPIFIGSGSTDGGLSDTGRAVGGQPPHKERNRKEEINKKEFNNKLDDENRRLDFKNEFGVNFPQSISNLINETRACSIAKKEKLTPEDVRRCIAEFSAEAIRGFYSEPVAAWVWLCRKQNESALALSKLGEENIPPWG